MASAGRLVARIERLRHGRRGRSALLHSLSFDAFNKRFEPARTKFDWLSRRSAEVDRYVADPLCGFPASVQLWIDLLIPASLYCREHGADSPCSALTGSCAPEIT